MGRHLIDGKFQSDKYPTTPAGKVPLSAEDQSAQDLLWEYAQRRRLVDTEFADDLEEALRIAGFQPPPPVNLLDSKPTPIDADDTPLAYAIVEIFGHRKHAGRVLEVEQFGTKMLRVDVPKDGDFAKGYDSHFYGGGSVFSLTPCTLATVIKANKPYVAAQLFHRSDVDSDGDV